MTDINSRIVLMHTMAMLFFGAAILCLVAAVLFFYFFDLKDDIDREVRKYKRLKKKKEAEEAQEDEEEEIDEEKATPEDMEFSTLLVPEAAPPATSTRVIDGHAVDGRLEEEEEIDETGLYETLALRNLRKTSGTAGLPPSSFPAKIPARQKEREDKRNGRRDTRKSCGVWDWKTGSRTWEPVRKEGSRPHSASQNGICGPTTRRKRYENRKTISCICTEPYPDAQFVCALCTGIC